MSVKCPLCEQDAMDVRGHYGTHAYWCIRCTIIFSSPQERRVVPIDPTDARPCPPSDGEQVSGPALPPLALDLEADAGGAE